MAKSFQTLMSVFMSRAAGVNTYGQLVGPAFIPNISVKIDDYTVTAAESGTIFTTTGATKAINFTLPAIADGPFEFRFLCGADQSLTVTAATADTLVAFNDLTADSVALSTSSEKIGGGFQVVCDGTTLFAYALLGDGRYQTVTIATA